MATKANTEPKAPARLSIGIPKWREKATSTLKNLKEQVRGTAPAAFMEKLNEAIQEATGTKRK